MKSLRIFALSFALVPMANAGFSLSGQPEIKEAAYNAQLATISAKVKNSLKVTGSIAVAKDALSMAPLVVTVDFQKLMKVAQGVRVLGEYSSWIDLEQASWGFVDAVNSADEQIFDKLEEKLGGTIAIIAKSTKSASSMFISYPVGMPDLNHKMPNYSKTLVANDSFGFSVEDIAKATNLELADADDIEGVVFFPYVNIALHKQTATTSQMNGELMINYKVGMNGYFSLCKKTGCVTAAFPNNGYIDLIVPLVHRKEATSEKGHIAAREYGQELMAQMIAEFTIEAFDKLTKGQE